MDIDQQFHSYKHYQSEVSVNMTIMAYRWAQGVEYNKMGILTFEGSFTRGVLQLSNICDEIVNLFSTFPDLANPVLEKKINDLKPNLLRDIVSFDSLYLKDSL